MLKAASTIKKILPLCLVFLGGPEVSHDSEDLMRGHGFIDMIFCGEGEIPFSHFIDRFEKEQSILGTPAACIRNGESIVSNPRTKSFDMNDMPFLYDDLGAYQNKVVYYETSRGCPFRCAYCMSANEEMSYLSFDRVQEELEYFIKSNIRQVKLVDRTFNYPPKRAYQIIKTLIELSDKYPQSATNFHLEISASLLNEQTLALLRVARKNLIQVEVGIQSTHPDTLKAIHRTHDMHALLRNTAALCDMDTIHVHVDLIAGLPCEDYDTFRKSFNEAYALGADKLQLGFLKVLKGSSLRDMANEYDIKYTDYAPYEVLSTRDISYLELEKLHIVAHTLDALYNSGHFSKSLGALIPLIKSPFDFFEAFALYLDAHDFYNCPQKKKRLFEMLYSFSKTLRAKDNTIKEALIFDWLCIERPRNWPDGLEFVQTEETKKRARAFFSDTANITKYLPEYAHISGTDISKRCFICAFNCLFPGQHVLFDYGKSARQENFFQVID